ncbi:hypothetical protein JCM1841_006407 [Sporobolomyces salmonicolor]
MSVARSSASRAPSAFPPPPLSVSSHAHSVFPSLRTPSSSVNGHTPLHKEDFPLLHSLIESPEYKAAVTKHPELTRRPTARRQSGRGAGGQSNRSSSSRPTKHNPPRSGANAVNELRNKADPDLSVAAIRGSGVDWDMVPDALETSEYGVCSSNRQPKLAMLSSAQSASAFLASSMQGTKRRNIPRSSFSSLHKPTPSLATPSTPPPKLHRQQHAPQPPATDPVSRSLPDLPYVATLSFPPTEPAFLSCPYPVHSVAHCPQHSASSLALSTGPRKPSTSFNNAAAHLKRMLRRTSCRPHPRCKNDRPISESSFSGASILMGGRSRSESLLSEYVDAGMEKLANTEGNTRRPLPVVVPSSSNSSIPVESSYPARRSSLPLPSPPAPRPVQTRLRPNPLQARPARPAASEIAQSLKARRQLFQILREGPGGDVARASPVLQNTVQKARQGGKTGLGECKWTPSMPSLKGGEGLLGRRAINHRSARSGDVGDTEGGRKPSQPSIGSAIGTRSLATSAEAAEEAKLWHVETIYSGSASFVRPASHGGTGVTLARGPSQDGYDQDEREAIESCRLMSSYWSYGSRWVDCAGTSASGAALRWSIEEEEEERKVWSKWRKWVRERRDAVRTEA